jgi:hypothetical protein
MFEFSEYHLPRGSEYQQLPQMCDCYEQANQSIAIGGASVQSAAFGPKTQNIVVSQITADCRVKIGPSTDNAGAGPIAVSAGVGQTRFLKAGNEYAFRVHPGEFIAVIQA